MTDYYKYVGTEGPSVQKKSQSYDPSMGWFTTLKYRGTEASLQSKVAELVAVGAKMRLDPESESDGYYTITADIPTAVFGGTTTDPALPVGIKWWLEGNDLEKTLWEHPRMVAELVKIKNYIESVTFKKFLDEYISGSLAATYYAQAALGFDIIVTDTIRKKYLLDVTVLKEFCFARSAGVEAYPASQYVLRRVIEIPPLSSIVPSFINVGKMFRPATLIAAETPNGLIPRLIASINTIGGYWLKRTPKDEPGTGANRLITQEYWQADNFSAFVYGAAI